jgi:hypothetical protein
MIVGPDQGSAESVRRPHPGLSARTARPADWRRLCSAATRPTSRTAGTTFRRASSTTPAMRCTHGECWCPRPPSETCPRPRARARRRCGRVDAAGEYRGLDAPLDTSLLANRYRLLEPLGRGAARERSGTVVTSCRLARSRSRKCLCRPGPNGRSWPSVRDRRHVPRHASAIPMSRACSTSSRWPVSPGSCWALGRSRKDQTTRVGRAVRSAFGGPYHVLAKPSAFSYGCEFFVRSQRRD